MQEKSEDSYMYEGTSEDSSCVEQGVTIAQK